MSKRNLQFKGFDEVKKILAKMPDVYGPKVVQEVLENGAKPLVKEARTNASHHDVTGNLSRSIGTLKGKGSQKGAGIYVGPRRGKGANAQGWHAHLVEYGTGPRRVKKKKVMFGKGKFFGTEVGPMPATPFLRPAWDATNKQVEQQIGEGFKQVLQDNFKGK